jgi:hypothetical protein
MHRLHDVGRWVIGHQIDIGMAALFALFFAVIIEATGLGALARSAVRHIKNKLSQRSAARLRERIKQLETQRDRYVVLPANLDSQGLVF